VAEKVAGKVTVKPAVALCLGQSRSSSGTKGQ